MTHDERSSYISAVVTHPALGELGEALGAVPEESNLPLSVTPSVQAPPPQSFAPRVWNTNQKPTAVTYSVGES